MILKIIGKKGLGHTYSTTSKPAGYDKVLKVINSCITLDHWVSAQKMMRLYMKSNSIALAPYYTMLVKAHSDKLRDINNGLTVATLLKTA